MTGISGIDNFINFLFNMDSSYLKELSNIGMIGIIFL